MKSYILSLLFLVSIFISTNGQDCSDFDNVGFDACNDASTTASHPPCGCTCEAASEPGECATPGCVAATCPTTTGAATTTATTTAIECTCDDCFGSSSSDSSDFNLNITANASDSSEIFNASSSDSSEGNSTCIGYLVFSDSDSDDSDDSGSGSGSAENVNGTCVCDGGSGSESDDDSNIFFSSTLAGGIGGGNGSDDGIGSGSAEDLNYAAAARRLIEDNNGADISTNNGAESETIVLKLSEYSLYNIWGLVALVLFVNCFILCICWCRKRRMNKMRVFINDTDESRLDV